MSENQTPQIVPETPDSSQSPLSTFSPSHERRSKLPVIAGAIAFLLLAGGEAYLFQNRSGTQSAVQGQSVRIAALDSQVATLRTKMAALDHRLTTLATRPEPKQVAAQSPVAPQIPAELETRIAAMQANLAALSTASVADHAALVTLQGKAADLPKLVAKAQELARIAQASLALQNGDKLGPIASAPEALVRYADTRPPTLGALKSAFPAYAHKAVLASDGDNADAGEGGFWQKLRARVESLVTVRRGTTVLVGGKAEGVLAAAQQSLDNDDLARALADLKTLPAPARSVMAPWIKNAADLLAARAALAAMAERS